MCWFNVIRLLCQLAVWGGGEAEGWGAARSTWEQGGLLHGAGECQGEGWVHLLTSVSAIRSVSLVGLWLSVMAMRVRPLREWKACQQVRMFLRLNEDVFKTSAWAKRQANTAWSHPKHEEGSVWKAKYQKMVLKKPLNNKKKHHYQ